MVRVPNVRIVLPLAAINEAPGCVVRLTHSGSMKNTDFRSCVNQEPAPRDLVPYKKQAVRVAGCHGPY